MERLLECNCCKTVVGRVKGKGKICCCGQELTPIENGEKVKLQPEISVIDQKVSININCKEKKFDGFIYLKTVDGGQRKEIKNRNEFCFLLCDDKPISLTIVLINIGSFIMDLKEIYR